MMCLHVCDLLRRIKYIDAGEPKSTTTDKQQTNKTKLSKTNKKFKW